MEAQRKSTTPAIAVMFLLLLVGGAFAYFSVRTKAVVPGNEAAAIGSLISLYDAHTQALASGHDPATLAELGELEGADGVFPLDGQLASGVKQGYVFARLGPRAWKAEPHVPGTTGTRYFAILEDGRLLSLDRPLTLPPPADATEVYSAAETAGRIEERRR